MYQGQAFCFHTVWQEAAEAYPMETGWEDMAEEGRNKLLPIHSQGFLFSSIRVILIVESDPVRTHRINTAVAGRGPECITSLNFDEMNNAASQNF